MQRKQLIGVDVGVRGSNTIVDPTSHAEVVANEVCTLSLSLMESLQTINDTVDV